MNFGALGGDDINKNGAAGILGLVGIDDLDSEGESVFDFTDVLGIEGSGDEFRGAFDGGLAADDLNAGLGGFVEQDDCFAIDGMSGEGVLGVLVAEVNLVTFFDDDLSLGSFSGGVDLNEEDSGRRAGFGGGDFEGWV